MATPYRPNGRTTRVEDRTDLMDILRFYPGLNPFHASQLSTLIMDAGFTRPKINRVSKTQMWTYFWETSLLAICAYQVRDAPGLGFVYGALIALAIGGAVTFLSGLIINHGIKAGAIK